jgi:hypothetical protein
MLDDIWRFTLLGDFQVQQGTASTDRFRTRKTAALLGYLALYHHKAHTREELATLLWPEATPELGLKSLGVALSSLRKLLEPPGVPAGTVLIADRRTARLAAQAIHTDVAAFRQALQSVPIQNLTSYKAVSPPYYVTLPPGNIFGLPPITYGPTFSAGYYVLLHPLPPGQHTIHFYFEFYWPPAGQILKLNNTYLLTVLPGK